MRKVLLTWLKFNFDWNFAEHPPTFLLVQDSLAYHFADSLITPDKLTLLYKANVAASRHGTARNSATLPIRISEIFKNIFTRGSVARRYFRSVFNRIRRSTFIFTFRYQGRSFIFITRKMCRARTSSRNLVTYINAVCMQVNILALTL